MAQPTIEQSFSQAVQHHQAGRLPKAEEIYRQILSRQPNHPDAVHNLGVLAVQTGRCDEGLGLLGRARVLKPKDAAVHNNLGGALKMAGRRDEAMAAFQQAIELNPSYADALSNLGSILMDCGELDRGIAALRRAIALSPAMATAHSNLGNALCAKGELGDAITACRKAIALAPAYAEAYCNLGNALHNKGELEQAIAAYQQALEINPRLAEAYCNLSRALRDKHDLDGALHAAQQAIAIKADYANAYNNLGTVLRDQRDMAGAVAAFRKAIALNADLANAHFNLGTSLLSVGEYCEGWNKYEWRRRLSGEPSALQLKHAQPLWEGARFDGRTLLLLTEQGLGDTLQFVRYVPLVAERGGRVVLHCPPELLRLLQPLSTVCQLVSTNQPLPQFDLQCTLLSLPRVFATTVENVPGRVPYIQAAENEVANWRDRLATDPETPRLTVGVVWGGSSLNPNDRMRIAAENRARSISLSRLAPLGAIRGIRFVSLQKGPAAGEANSPPAGMRLLNFTEELRDMADTAALVANLDLVIGVDTAVIHLAGAMSKAVWALLPYNADWRWLLERDGTPWYPSMRLFRHGQHADWDAVIERVAKALANFS